MRSLSGWKSKHIPSPLPLASGLLLLISPKASESSLKGTEVSVHFCSLLLRLIATLTLIAALTHLRRPQSGQINNVGTSIPPATPVIGWKCGCCSACPVSLSNQIVCTRTHEHNNQNRLGEAGDTRWHMRTVSHLYHESTQWQRSGHANPPVTDCASACF